MRVGLYSPFAADIAGGGERYLLTIAECLLPEHQVDLIVSGGQEGLKQKFIDAFHLKLDGLNIVTGPFGPHGSAWQRFHFTKKYDVFYYMTDGSFFIPGAKRNIAHFMIPFNQRPGLWQWLKLNTWQIKTTHSDFCKEALERIWKIKINFVQPGAVDGRIFPPGQKQNLIISVGRWFSPAGNKHCKRQDFLVASFKKMCDQGLQGWRLILTGMVDPGRDNRGYLQQVKQLARGYPVEFHLDASFSQLRQDYGRAKIYWHATGYGSNEQANPQAMEHFGISTIEAMSAGAVPVVIKKGGQKEVVSHNGLFWENQRELMEQTLRLINDESFRYQLADAARRRSQDFSRAKFCQTTHQIFAL